MRRPPEQNVLADGDVAGNERHLRDESDMPRELPAASGALRRRRTRARRPSYSTRPATARSAVVLPAPFGPISATHSPSLDLVREPVDDRVAAERDATRVERERGHAYRLLVRSTTAKNGAPKNAVTTPIGSSAGDITVRAITSAKTRKPAPTITESGSSSR